MKLYIVHTQYQHTIMMTEYADDGSDILSYHKTMEGAVNKIASEKGKQDSKSDVNFFITINVVED